MMRALTLWQPWAAAIFAEKDPKDIENRTRLRPPKELLERGPSGLRPFFAVHAGARYDDSPGRCAKLRAFGEDVSEHEGWAFPEGVRVPTQGECFHGAVIGVARIRYGYDTRTRTTIGVEDPRHELGARALQLAAWWLGPIGVQLEDAVLLTEPVPCRGLLGYWRLDEDVERRVRQRIPVW